MAARSKAFPEASCNVVKIAGENKSPRIDERHKSDPRIYEIYAVCVELAGTDNGLQVTGLDAMEPVYFRRPQCDTPVIEPVEIVYGIRRDIRLQWDDSKN